MPEQIANELKEKLWLVQVPAGAITEEKLDAWLTKAGRSISETSRNHILSSLRNGEGLISGPLLIAIRTPAELPDDIDSKPTDTSGIPRVTKEIRCYVDMDALPGDLQDQVRVFLGMKTRAENRAAFMQQSTAQEFVAELNAEAVV
jgi:hypothetical protein